MKRLANVFPGCMRGPPANVPPPITPRYGRNSVPTCLCRELWRRGPGSSRLYGGVGEAEKANSGSLICRANLLQFWRSEFQSHLDV